MYSGENDVCGVTSVSTSTSDRGKNMPSLSVNQSYDLSIYFITELPTEIFAYFDINGKI